VFPTSTRDAGICGSLEHFKLSTLLTILEMDRKSGLLVLLHPEMAEIGRLFLRRGRVVRARLQTRRRRLEKHDVIYDLLGWSRGSFEFYTVEVESADEVGMSTTRLLLEGARRMDEAFAGRELRSSAGP
jgi:hypothetical protein